MATSVLLLESLKEESGRLQSLGFRVGVQLNQRFTVTLSRGEGEVSGHSKHLDEEQLASGSANTPFPVFMGLFLLSVSV